MKYELIQIFVLLLAVLVIVLVPILVTGNTTNTTNTTNTMTSNDVKESIYTESRLDQIQWSKVKESGGDLVRAVVYVGQGHIDENFKSKINADVYEIERVEDMDTLIPVLHKSLFIKGHILILMEGCDYSSIDLEKIKHVDEELDERWDVISFDSSTFQVVKSSGIYIDAPKKWKCIVPGIQKIYDSNSRAFIVNEIYIETLLESLMEGLNVPECQKIHQWVNVTMPDSEDVFKRKRIAICNVATGKYVNYVDSIVEECKQNFLRCHDIEFFLFTDSDIVESEKFHVHHIDRKGFPGDTLFRYHYMLLKKKELKEFDHIFYMDVDYVVYKRPDERLFLVDGLVATAHLHNITEVHRGNHIGSPETDPKSTACIGPEDRMTHYFAGGVQGGSSKAFLEMCETVKKNIDIDVENDVMAVYHDESHWNRYLVNHPPQSILNQSYIYPEECLEGVDKEMCHALLRNNIKPIMLPKHKNHSEIRI